MGRPKKGANRPKQVYRGGAKPGIQRQPSEFPNGYTDINSFRMDPYSKTLLMLHAKQRHTTLTALLSDVLNGWLGLVTDYNEDYFRVNFPKGHKAADVPERWPGYLASLGFAPAVRLAQAEKPKREYAAKPEPPVPLHAVPPPPDDPDDKPEPEQDDPIAQPATPPPAPQQTVVVAEMKHPEIQPPIPQGPRSGVGIFNAEEHRKNARAPGHGSAAQEFELGLRPDERLPEERLR